MNAQKVGTGILIGGCILLAVYIIQQQTKEEMYKYPRLEDDKGMDELKIKSRSLFGNDHIPQKSGLIRDVLKLF